jgi:hypothetical protein
MHSAWFERSNYRHLVQIQIFNHSFCYFLNPPYSFLPRSDILLSTLFSDTFNLGLFRSLRGRNVSYERDAADDAMLYNLAEGAIKSHGQLDRLLLLSNLGSNMGHINWRLRDFVQSCRQSSKKMLQYSPCVFPFSVQIITHYSSCYSASVIATVESFVQSTNMLLYIQENLLSYRYKWQQTSFQVRRNLMLHFMPALYLLQLFSRF